MGGIKLPHWHGSNWVEVNARVLYRLTQIRYHRSFYPHDRAPAEMSILAVELRQAGFGGLAGFATCWAYQMQQGRRIRWLRGYAIATTRKGLTWRHSMYPGYKAGRLPPC